MSAGSRLVVGSMVGTPLGMWVELDNLNDGDCSADEKGEATEKRQSRINGTYEVLFEG